LRQVLRLFASHCCTRKWVTLEVSQKGSFLRQ
jgi:hypothetical protein